MRTVCCIAGLGSNLDEFTFSLRSARQTVPRLFVVAAPKPAGFLRFAEVLTVGLARGAVERFQRHGPPRSWSGWIPAHTPTNVRNIAVLDADVVKGIRCWPGERRGCGLVEEDVQKSTSSAVSSVTSRSSLVRMAESRLLAGPLAATSRPRTGAGPGYRCVALQRASRRNRLGCGPLSGLARVPGYEGRVWRCRPDFPPWKPTGCRHIGQSNAASP